MKILKSFSLAIVGLSLIATSCKDNKNEAGQEEMKTQEKEMNHKEMDHGNMDHNEMNHDDMASDMGGKAKAEFKSEATAAIFQHYIHVKTALVNSNMEEAKKGGEMLSKAIADSNKEAKVIAEKIAQAGDIESQRKAFSDLTAQMENILKGALSSGEVYMQYCPMAFNNKGGYWISAEKEIKNPYFGDKMLNCGATKSVIQ
ncbi:DUF3347 domain-containing protein [Christiangramia salexigens]|uniref:DUF3347 domain-containing protein n=1 Tax=Christiangramia salexigens TaxID=1913577 RepID=A0A1L3J7G9_9FLAO|nr:DUF3347 domain-containing protein [Christiangramia salexigens]APG61086.1 hypothetical protein LPB144_12000 [Christiangramia salexigens]